MKTMRKLGMIALMLALGALFFASPVLANGHGDLKGPLWSKLVPPEVNPPEPQASGKYKCDFPVPLVPVAGVTVICTKLTPGQQYSVCSFGGCYPATADRKGGLEVLFFTDEYYGFICVVNDAGEVVLEEQSQ
jgi:hypothetical protein